jgi:hypothetical protein
MKTIISKIITLIVFVIIGVHCSSEEKNPVDPGVTPAVTGVVALEKWNNLRETTYQIEVHVSDPQGPGNLASVHLEIQSEQTGTIVLIDSLYDDGNYPHTGSGDVFAGDGVFSNRFSAADISAAPDETLFSLRLTAVDKDDHTSQPEILPLIIGANHRPVIETITVPDSISADLAEMIFSVAVSDSDGTGDIAQVYFESDNLSKGYTKFEQFLYDDGDRINHGDESAVDGIFSTLITPDFAGGKKGTYDLKFYATDSYAESNTGTAVHQIYIGNLPPAIINISVPDSLHIPENPEAYNYKMISVQVSDPEGLATIDSVYFISLKPDLTYANGGEPFLMVDNGSPFNINTWWEEAGDVQAGDGIYSYALIVRNDFIPGVYRFSFFVRDKAGNLTGPETHPINLIGDAGQTQ